MAEFDEIIDELNPENKGYLGPTVKKIVRELEAIIERGEQEKAWRLINKLPQMCDDCGNQQEAAEIRVRCAQAARRLGNLHQALKLLKDAEERYCSFSHQQGIIFYLQGKILLELRSGPDDAIITLRKSIRIFEKIPESYRYLNTRNKIWYEGKCEELRKKIAEIVNDNDRFP